MKLISSTIVGSGISALICSMVNPNSKVLFSKNNEIIKNHKFYEFNTIGGNTNVWGAYINLHRLEKFEKKNKGFKSFLEKNEIFKIKKLTENKKFKKVGFISLKNNDAPLKINIKFFNKRSVFELDKIKIFRNFVVLSDKKGKKINCKKLNLCVGNINLLKVLLNSDIIKKNDMISFDDGKIGYSLINYFRKYNDYLIPMTLSQAIRKLFFLPYLYNQEEKYKFPILQVSKSDYKKYNLKVENLIHAKEKLFRGFNSNHITNLRVNNVPIQKIINSKSNKINVFCTGTISKYIPGSVSQDLIYNAFIKKLKKN